MVDHDEACRPWRSGPGGRVWNLWPGAHRNPGVGKEGRRRLGPKRGEVHGREVHQKTHLEFGVFLESTRNLKEKLPAENHRGIASVLVGGCYGSGETVFDGLNQSRTH